MAVLGLRLCARAFSGCGELGPLFIAVRGPLIIVASLVAERRLQTRRLSSCGSWAQLLRSMWDLPGPGHEPVCPALAGGFSTTAPPGKPEKKFFDLGTFQVLFTISVNGTPHSSATVGFCGCDHHHGCKYSGCPSFQAQGRMFQVRYTLSFV